MKEEAGEKKGSGSTLMMLLALAGVVLLVVIFFLHRGADKAGKDLTRAKAEYNEMKEWRKKIAEMQKRAPQGAKTQAPTEKTDDVETFFQDKAKKAGLPTPPITPPSRATDSGGGWKEFPFSVGLVGTKEAPLSRVSVVTFLQAIETERPYLKTKNLMVKFADNDVKEFTVIISFFKSDR